VREGCDIEKVGERLEHAVMSKIQGPTAPKELYDMYEQTAIAILDGEYMLWPDGLLECYLHVQLHCLSKELGLSEIA